MTETKFGKSRGDKIPDMWKVHLDLMHLIT